MCGALPLAQAQHDDKKGAYDKMMAGLESNKSKLESDVRTYKEEIAQDESRYHYLHNMIRILTVQVPYPPTPLPHGHLCAIAASVLAGTPVSGLGCVEHC